MVARPSETVQAVVSGILGAILIIVGYLDDGFQIDDVNAETIGAVTLLVGFVASAVTWYIGRRQRAGELGSNLDGTVQS